MQRPEKTIYWIGGSARAGKSTVANMLAERHGLHVFHTDNTWGERAAMATKEKQPFLYRVRNMTWDEIWSEPIELEVENYIKQQEEELGLLVKQVENLPYSQIVVEGVSVLPRILLDYPHIVTESIWLVASPQVIEKYYPGPDQWEDQARYSNHFTNEYALGRFLKRDQAFAEYVAEEAGKIKAPLIHVESPRVFEGLVDGLEKKLKLS